MTSGRTRRIVVIRDIPSNTIEEAILILKSEAGDGEGPARELPRKSVKRDNNFLLKEAEMIINGYMKEGRPAEKVQKAENTTNRKIPKFDAAKRKLLTNVLINLALVGSIALLILFAVRLF